MKRDHEGGVSIPSWVKVVVTARQSAATTIVWRVLNGGGGGPGWRNLFCGNSGAAGYGKQARRSAEGGCGGDSVVAKVGRIMAGSRNQNQRRSVVHAVQLNRVARTMRQATTTGGSTTRL